MGKALKPSQRIDLLSRILRFDLTDADAARMREELRRAEAWPELADEAMRHLVAPLLYLRGTRHGLLQDAPAEFTEFLELAHRLNGERNRRLLEQAQLNRLGVLAEEREVDATTVPARSQRV